MFVCVCVCCLIIASLKTNDVCVWTGTVNIGGGYTAAARHRQRDEHTVPHQNTQTATLQKQKLLLLSEIPFTPICQFRVDLICPWSVWKMNWGPEVCRWLVTFVVMGLRGSCHLTHPTVKAPGDAKKLNRISQSETGMLETLHSSAAGERCVWFYMTGMFARENNSSLLERQRVRSDPKVQ